jgi:hypothetical protein
VIVNGSGNAKGRVLRKQPHFSKAHAAQLQQTLAHRPERLDKPPPPLRPKRSDERLADEQELPFPSPNSQSYGQFRSAETFTQPDRPSTAPMSSQTAFYPPPRRSSRYIAGPPGILPDQIPNDFSQFFPQPPPQPRTDKELTQSGEWDALLPLYQSRATMVYGQREPPLAPTSHVSNGDPPLSISPPLFSVPLEKIIEEREGPASARQSASFARPPSLRHSRSSPSLCRKGLFTEDAVPELPRPLTSMERPVSQGSDTLGDPDHPSVRLSQEDVKATSTKPEPRSFLSMSQDLTDTWEDDIDYCYEHAAEANCDFDWSNTSRLELGTSDEEEDEPRPWEQKKRVSRHHKFHFSVDSTSTADTELSRTHNGTFFLSGLHAPELLPDLDSQSAHSISTSSFGALTPADKLSLQSNGGADTVSTPEIPSSDSPMPSAYDEVLGEYHEFLIEAKSLPVGVRPKSRLRQEGKVNRIAPTSVPVQLPSQKLASEDAPRLRSRADSAPGQRPSPSLTLGSIVDRLRSPQASPESPTFPQNERKGRDSPKPARYRSRSRQQKLEDTVGSDPVPPIPTRSPSHTGILAALRMPSTSQKPLTPPETPATISSAPDADGVNNNSGYHSSSDSTDTLPLQTLPATTFDSAPEPTTSRKASLARTVSAATVPFMLDDSSPPPHRPAFLGTVDTSSPPLTPAFSVTGHEPLLRLSQLDHQVEFIFPPSPGFPPPPSPKRAPPQIPTSAPHAITTPQNVPAPSPAPLKDPHHLRDASNESAQIAAQEETDMLAPLTESFSPGSSSPPLLGTRFPAPASSPKPAEPTKPTSGAEGSGNSSPKTPTRRRRGHQSYSLFPVASTKSSEVRIGRVFTN